MSAITDWLARTPNRTFVLYPVLVIVIELVLRGGSLVIVPWGALLLIWGYVQYRHVGIYRRRLGKGGPGVDVPPEQLVTDGPYGYVRNPMYLGHLIFMLGLAVTFWSWAALLLLIGNAAWFHRRVRKDERRLHRLFGRDFEEYRDRVKRWVPRVL